MSQDFLLRDAYPCDQFAIFQLSNLYYRQTGGLCFDEIGSYFESANERITLIEYLPESLVVAFIMVRTVRGGVTKVYQLCVHEEFRGCGLAQLLLSTLRGSVTLTVFSDNVDAQMYFENIGFELTKRTKQANFYFHPNINVVLPCKLLIK